MLGPKQTLAETALYDDRPSSINASALFEPAIVLTIDRGLLAQLILKYPDVGLGILRTVSYKIRDLQQLAVENGSGSAELTGRLESSESTDVWIASGDTQGDEEDGQLSLEGFLRQQTATAPLPLILDFSQRDRLNGVQWHALLRLAEHYHRSGQALALCGMSESIRQWMNIPGLTAFLPHYSTRAAAIQSLSSRS